MKIFCLERNLGKFVYEQDNGFGARMRDWTYAYILSTFIDDIEILVQPYFWPELLFLDLPKTSTKKLSKSEHKNLHPLNFDQIKYLIKTKDSSILDKEKIYYLKFPTQSMNNSIREKQYLDELELFGNQFEKFSEYQQQAFSKIKLKNINAENFLRENFSKVAWIHMRRGHEAIPTIKFFKEVEQYFPKEKIPIYWNDYNIGSTIGRYTHETRNKFLEKISDPNTFSWCVDKITTEIYRIISDEFYFKIIDSFLLGKDKDQKIYISSDIPMHFYSHYYEKYPNNLIDKKLYFKEFFKLYKDEYFVKNSKKLKFSTSLKQTFINVFDLLVGFNSSIAVSTKSCWGSMVCNRMRANNKKFIYLYNDFELGEYILDSNLDGWQIYGNTGDFK
jgi:hypothetical protein